jgi:hypothetical protein
MRRLLALAALLVVGSVANAQAATITFEDHAVPPLTANPFSGDLTSGGFLFTFPAPNNQLANNSANITDGSTYLVIEVNLTQVNLFSQATFSQIGGAPFALLSFDYAKWQGPTLAAATITVTGNKAGGGTVTQLLSPVGDFTAGGRGTDLQAFAFGPQWTNLSSVVLQGTGAMTGTLNYFAIDNIGVDTAPVPEPGTLTLLGLSSAYLIRRRRA